MVCVQIAKLATLANWANPDTVRGRYAVRTRIYIPVCTPRGLALE